MLSFHRTGSLESSILDVEKLRDYLNTVLEIHKPSIDCQVPYIHFPQGFFIEFSTDVENPPFLGD